MKKLLAVVLSIAMLLCLSITAFAEEAESVEVNVTISDDKGNFVVSLEKITVTDTDGDSALTISDALYAAHEAKYEGGAAAGYSAVNSEYGLSLDKLWGISNGGSYGYYLNDASALSLLDTLKDGDRIYAYAFTDLEAWSDTYSFFDVTSAAVKSEDEITLTLSAAGYDEAWNPVTLAVEGAFITVDGEVTEYVTDENGKVILKLDNAGEHIISAVSETITLVPPVCKVTVTAAAEAPVVPENKPSEEENNPAEEKNEASKEQTTSPQTGNNANAYIIMLIAAAALAAYAKRKKVNG